MVSNNNNLMQLQTDINDFYKVNYKEIVILIIVLCYFSIGIFPAVPVECDSVNIANGIKLFDKYGIGPNIFTYSYDVQAGSYFFSYMLSKLVDTDPFTIFAILSAISGIVIIIISSLLISKNLKINILIPFFTFFLFQESYSILYYPNTNIIAAFFATIAFFILYEHHNLYISSILFAIAIWCRIDVVLVGLVFPFILINRDNLKMEMKNVLIFISINIFILIFLFTLSDVNINNIINRFIGHRNNTNGLYGVFITKNIELKSLITFFTPLTIFLILRGGVQIFIKKRLELYFILSGILPLIIIYLGSITTPKYLYYCIPFFVFISSYILITFCPNKLMRSICILLFLQYIIGINSSNYNRLPPEGINILNVNYNSNNNETLTFNLGSGNYIGTADGFRLSSGLLFSPLSWRLIKKNRQKYFNKIYIQITNYENIYTIYYPTYLIHLLLQNNWNNKIHYDKEREYRLFTFVKNQDKIKLIFDRKISKYGDKVKKNKINKPPESIMIKVLDWEDNL